ncbi:hypothetical protein [Streptomyces sp. I5]|uniref:hypothetical protein n=1 Tax=Streptomyces sp. I5 TaxID=2759947 RepID=UPI0018EE59A9|nr:hypothetical protein [Streptomyces sp. I5]MBJ6633066.1 hypothetical protein [Streptomyces sp. I5]
MTSRGKTLRLAAVSTLVVLALTGFSTGRGHGGSSGDGGGGGCSSSSQNHDSSSGGSHRDYDDDDYGSSGGSGGSGGSEASISPDAATVTLVDCASEETPYATVEVTNTDTVDGTFSVTVVFRDAAGEELDSGTEEVSVPAGGTTPVRIPVNDAESVPLIEECDLSYA